jgi:hypothetical protein
LQFSKIHGGKKLKFPAKFQSLQNSDKMAEILAEFPILTTLFLAGNLNIFSAMNF